MGRRRHPSAPSRARNAEKRGPVRPGRSKITWVAPSKGAVAAARRYLDRSAELPASRRGALTPAEAKKQGITSGVERAESIAAGELQPAEDIKAFFSRFRGTYLRALESDRSWDQSKVQQAWDAWGGTPMWRDAMKALGESPPELMPNPEVGGKCVPPRAAAYIMIPEYEGFSFAEQAYPFSAEAPLLFHVLVDAPEFDDGERQALDMLQRDVSLLPASEVPGASELFFPRDRAAGDDRYIFFTPLTTFGSTEALTAHNRQDVGRPAFAFDARMIWDMTRGGFGFRVHDLEAGYHDIEPLEVDPTSFDEDYDLLSPQDRDAAYEEALADSVADDLQCYASAGTITRHNAWRAMEIYARRAGGMLSADEAERLGAPLIPEMPDEDWCPLAFETARRLGLHDQWIRMFRGYGNPRDTIWGPRQYKPEVLVRGEVPLRCASWFRNRQGVWVRLPSRPASNPRRPLGYAAFPQRT